MILGW